MSIFTESFALTVYEDANSSNNPLERIVSWQRTFPNISVNNPLSRKYTVPANASLTVFNGTVSTSIDGTSAFSIALNAYNSSIYRITNTGGTAPVFRTDRALAQNGNTITVVVNNNATATFATSGTYPSVTVGDTVFVPSTLTGDAALSSPFNILNGGLWVVLAATSTVLTLTRPAGTDFSAAAEAVVLSSSAQLQAFSSAGVQVGNTLEISAGFSPVTRKSYIVSAVTPSWVEFVSTESLPLETGILPTASGMIFYSDAKRFIRVEADQPCYVRFNGDTSNNNRCDPREVASKSGVAWNEKWGTCWQLVIVNRSTSTPLNVVVLSAE